MSTGSQTLVVEAFAVKVEGRIRIRVVRIAILATFFKVSS
jgi:hypothetical protein